MAPANNKKLSMAPRSTEGKSTRAMRPEKYGESAGFILSSASRLMDVMMASSMIPMAGGSFRYRLLIKANNAESTTRIENVKYKSIGLLTNIQDTKIGDYY